MNPHLDTVIDWDTLNLDTYPVDSEMLTTGQVIEDYQMKVAELDEVLKGEKTHNTPEFPDIPLLKKVLLQRLEFAKLKWEVLERIKAMKELHNAVRL